jgi:hypothetical protein
LPRVLLSYPTDANDLLLSGELVGGENLAGHAILIDQQIGKGHVVLFGVRPFWRYETSGNYPLVFNAMLNWIKSRRGAIESHCAEFAVNAEYCS